MYIKRFSIIFLTMMLIFCSCPQKPPQDAEEMIITETTRVVYHYGGVKPVLVAVLDEGDIVKARRTSHGWYKIWWWHKGKWKTGYVKQSSLRASLEEK
jgi:hypothetical protein